MEVERSDMKNKSFFALVTFIIVTLLVGTGMTAWAAETVAKVTSVTGEAFIQTGTTTIVIKTGQAIISGDKIQTRDGEVKLVFTDGALMTINPFSTAMIQERVEESGLWVFKTKKLVRRMTAFVGKLNFKSGASKRDNYLQTPTAVCGLRGSEVDFGYNNAVSLLYLISGAINTYGTAWATGPFANPGAAAALQNSVYQKLNNTVTQVNKAYESGNADDKALATLNVYELAKLVGDLLKNNPDPNVQALGQSFIDEGTQGMANLQQQYPNLTTTVETTVPTTASTSAETTVGVTPTTVPTTIPTTISILPTTTTTSSSTTTVTPSQ